MPSSPLPLEVHGLQISDSRRRTADEFLLHSTPGGAFTQCRTIRFSSILMLAFHLRQLERSFLELEQDALQAVAEEQVKKLTADLRTTTTKLVTILLEFTRSCDLKDELLVTILQVLMNMTALCTM